METLLWLAILTGQVMWIVILFGWWKKCPNWKRICIAVAQIFMIIAVFWMSEMIP